MESTVQLKVNNVLYEISIPVDWSLARVLRDKLGLTGTKISCEHGDCGVCTVIMDGNAVHSCIVPAMDAQVHEIITIEGLSSGSQLHDVQKAFIKAGAIQCGFCTPGMVMAVTALYMKNPCPTQEEIQVAISGNLCRCTGYKKIIQVSDTLKDMKAGVSEEPAAAGKQIGVSRTRKDAFAKVTGRAKYVNDLHMEGMLYGAILRSKIPFGKIISVDTTKAKQLPGVEAVICATDVNNALFGSDVQDQPVFAFDYVRYAGEPLAAVAAIDQETADAALELIEVVIEELTPILEAPDSIKPNAPVIHENYESYNKNIPPLINGSNSSKNLCFHARARVGNVDEVFKNASRIIESNTVAHKTHPGYMEPHGSLSYYDENDCINIISSTQKPFFVRNMVCQAFGIPLNKLISKVVTIGGGFGGKTAMIQEPYTVALTIHTKKPVKIITSIKDEMISAANRHRIRFNYKTAIAEDGTILGRKIDILADAGAYTIDSPGTVSLFVHTACGPYRYENLEVNAYAVYTNTVPSGSNRAPGGLACVFASETHADIIAKAIDIDPLAFRLKNAVRKGEKLFNGQTIQAVGLIDCLTNTAEKLHWDKGQVEEGFGKGISCMWWCSGVFSGSVLTSVNDDGTVQILSGLNEIGTGSKVTSIGQIAAEAMGIDFDDVDLSFGSDTSHFAYEHGVGASRTVFSMGKAVLNSCEQIKEKLHTFMKEEGLAFDKAPRFEGGKIIVPETGKVFPLGRVAGMYKSKKGPLVGQSSINRPFPDYDASRLEAMLYPAFPGPTFAVQGAIARRDEETGIVEIKKMVSVQDVGYAINPCAIEGQMEGGIVMGVGYALTEELIITDGIVKNSSFSDYKMLTSMDIPEMDVVMLECAEEVDDEFSGPMGAKGVAECALAPAAGAIANALFAVSGNPEVETKLQKLN